MLYRQKESKDRIPTHLDKT